MDKWIEELTERAKGMSYVNGDLKCNRPYVSYSSDINDDNGTVVIDGRFTIEQLEALIKHMKKFNKDSDQELFDPSEYTKEIIEV